MDKDIDRLGYFYLGAKLNLNSGEASEEMLFYPSKDMTTHAVCVGMTGSGKTGLGIVFLEEAAIDGIPSIVIDPKGDMADLLLTFPELSASEFNPWIDPSEASSKGFSPEDYAENLSEKWKKKLQESGQDTTRILKLKQAVEMVVYTPANNAGIPLSILSSFSPPPQEILEDASSLRERIQTMASSLLGLLGIDADPIKSREHILLSTLINNAWQQNKGVSLPEMIQQIQKPPFDKIGVLDLETFYPAKDRLAFSISLNNLLASPGFQAWMEGEPLDIKNMLFNKDGKPKMSIVSIAHLGDVERMFFVTLLLNELLGWMRKQPGTTSLRAILYMDEIFGYFPPTANPPSKMPMITLLKQARAFGLGIFLSTQNPIDLDYKGLANCGTWFIGKLQTERDKDRLIDGLQVGSKEEFKKLAALTGSQKFIMNSIYEKEPILFQTRWALSYLKGPLTLTQISELMKEAPRPESKVAEVKGDEMKPVLPSGIPEYFIQLASIQRPVVYKPYVGGIGKVHYVLSKYKIDEWKPICLIAPLSEKGEVVWSEGEDFPEVVKYFSNTPLEESTFSPLPSELRQEKGFAKLEKALQNYLYSDFGLILYEASELGLVSKVGEKESEFRSKAMQIMREKRDGQVEVLKKKYGDKIAAVTEKMRKAEGVLDKQKAEASAQKRDTYLSMGMTLLGTLFGGKVTRGTLSKAETSFRRAGKIGKEDRDVASAEENLKEYQRQLSELESELQNEISKIAGTQTKDVAVQSLTIAPKKGDIHIEKLAIVWRPFHFSKKD